MEMQWVLLFWNALKHSALWLCDIYKQKESVLEFYITEFSFCWKGHLEVSMLQKKIQNVIFLFMLSLLLFL